MRPLWTHIPQRWRWPDTIPHQRREMPGEGRLRSYLMFPVRAWGRECWFIRERRLGREHIRGRRKSIREERRKLRRDGLL